MENIVTQKQTIRFKLASWINGLKKKNTFSRTKKCKKALENSKFNHYLDCVEKNGVDHEQVIVAVTICDEAITVAAKRLNLIEKLKKIDTSIESMKNYSRLTKEDVAKAKDLFSRLEALSTERKSLLYQLEGFGRSLSFMRDLESEAPKAITAIREAEGKQRIFKQDLGYLEGEKLGLGYELNLFEAGLRFIQKFSVGMAIFLGMALITLILMFITNNSEIIVPIFILTMFVIVIYALLVAFRRRIIFERKLNLKKQNRAVEIMNKKIVVYAHYTNFLNYEYKKFKIRNSEMLKDNLKKYASYKKIVARLDSVKNIMYQTESEIESFLKSKKIRNSEVSIEKFIATVDLDKSKSKYDKNMEAKKTIEKSLSLMDEKYEKLCVVLTDISEKDTTQGFLVQEIVGHYMDEASRLMTNIVRIGAVSA